MMGRQQSVKAQARTEKEPQKAGTEKAGTEKARTGESKNRRKHEPQKARTGEERTEKDEREGHDFSRAINVPNETRLQPLR